MAGSPKKRARKEKTQELAHQVPVKRQHASDTFDQQIADKVCDLIEYEGFWPEQAARAVGVNGKKLLESWAKTHLDFSSQYARARANASHKFANKAIDILEDAAKTDDYSSARVQAVKNCAQGYQWYASKLDPKVYGDRMQVDGDLNININLASALDVLKENTTE